MDKHIFNQSQRWYDKDPTLSLAVSFVRNVSVEQKKMVADRIIEQAKQMGVKINEIKVIFQRRWFDEDEKLGTAMEYLKQASPENQKTLALDIIGFLTEIKA
ncbi:MAG TPA: hypothetical protein P5556_09735 [Candidatus Gastranaerophilales bacterium]|nr:hypothetical protein [Candidatus Gastranaerophilales bacterium]